MNLTGRNNIDGMSRKLMELFFLVSNEWDAYPKIPFCLSANPDKSRILTFGYILF